MKKRKNTLEYIRLLPKGNERGKVLNFSSPTILAVHRFYLIFRFLLQLHSLSDLIRKLHLMDKLVNKLTNLVSSIILVAMKLCEQLRISFCKVASIL